jgi:hypothetical protein
MINWSVDTTFIISFVAIFDIIRENSREKSPDNEKASLHPHNSQSRDPDHCGNFGGEFHFISHKNGQ